MEQNHGLKGYNLANRQNKMPSNLLKYSQKISKSIETTEELLDGGGVFVGIHEDLISTENTSIITECEIEWSKVKLKNNKDLHTASFYMPRRNMKDLDNLRLSLDKLTNGKPKHVIIAGDFNCPDID